MTTLRTPKALAGAGLLPSGDMDALNEVASRYAVAVSPSIAALIDPADAADPIARQYLPSPAELNTAPHELADPIADGPHSPVPGIVHRYPDRVLLKLTHTCAVYCRFCFRREMVGPGGEGDLNGTALDAALAYIAGRPEIWEVILTGGDPLVLSARRVEAVMRRLGQIDHVKIVRIHTRGPVVDPDAVNDAMVQALAASGKTTYLAVHANHPRELSQAARAALARLSVGGVRLLSQTVLLRGVNDDAVTLASLMRAFVECGVRPYYLHQLDPAPGTSHFAVPIAEGQALVRSLRGHVSGLAQPTYILDTPGGHGKVPIGPPYLDEDAVRDPFGGVHKLGG
ncbi:MAG: lysine-2,3-aminomutase-like protein [Caulobacteraceae bacterium]